MMKNVLLIISFFIMTSTILSACATKEVNEGYNVYTQKTSKAIENKIYKMGETVELEGIQITIDKAYFTNPTKKSISNNGDILTIVLKIYSIPHAKGLNVDGKDFLIYDQEGNLGIHYDGYIESEISGNLSGENDTEDISYGVEGKVYFDIPKFDKYVLVFKPNYAQKNKEYQNINLIKKSNDEKHIKEIKFEITPN